MCGISCLLIPAAGTAQTGPKVQGPATLSPGETVRFRASGFRGGGYLSVVLLPADRPSCCAYRVPLIFAVSAGGTALLSFRFPAYYNECSGYGAAICRRRPWKHNERAVVSVSGYLENTTTTTRVVLHR